MTNPACWWFGHKFKMLPFILGGSNIRCERCGYQPSEETP